jgi:hypothetical protein
MSNEKIKKVLENIRKKAMDCLQLPGLQERMISRTEIGKTIVSTVSNDEVDYHFETGISSPLYNGGDWIIVSIYKTYEEAEKGHEKWATAFFDKEYPEFLEDALLKLKLSEENATVEDVGDWCFRFGIDRSEICNEELYKDE